MKKTNGKYEESLTEIGKIFKKISENLWIFVESIRNLSLLDFS